MKRRIAVNKKCVLYQGVDCSPLKIGRSALIGGSQGMEVETGPVISISTDNAVCASFETADARFIVLRSSSYAGSALAAA